MRTMLPWYRTRKRARRLLGRVLVVLGFLFCWSSLTLLILHVQDSLIAPAEVSEESSQNANNRGIQVVVGHYNGNLPKEKLENLTDEELNANNYSPVDGWGEGGKAVRLSIKEELRSEDTFGINQFNLYVSDRIALNRTLPDVRKQQCRLQKYPPASELPTTSVIIVYHNEAYSSLLRTVSSVVNRSPAEALAEIILVDDYSSRTFLRKPLDDFCRQSSVRIKIIRASERVGLIRARMMGAQEASGDVLTFLDSHCECTVGWLEPLLARIQENRKAVVCPIIDVINDRTFQYQKGIELFRGGFNWNLQFRWFALPSDVIRSRVENPAAPIDSPTMAGGLFSIDRRYFEELGEYDPGMDIWGGENLEISFRIWQCGGRVEILPCSHVGHIFRKASPHDFPGKSSGKILNNNLMRVAEVWMDEWKDLFYKTAPQALALRSTVDVSERVELRKRLACKSFRWYLENIFTDHFLPTPGDVFGRLRWEAGQLCLKWTPAPGSGIRKADSGGCAVANGTLWDRQQLWLYTKDGRIRSDEHLCLSAVQTTHTSSAWEVQLKECGGYDGEFWEYNTYTRSFVHRQSGLCLSSPKIQKGTAHFANKLEALTPPSIERCSRGGREQQWTMRVVSWQLADRR